MMGTIVLVAALVAPVQTGVEKPLEFHSVFQSHMVLQREKPVRISGTATAGAEVAVAFRGETRRAKADADGEWELSFSPGRAGGPYALTATCGGKSAVLEDVWVGEVWVASGQSNMDMPVWGDGKHYRLPDGEAVAAAAKDTRMRLLQVRRVLDVGLTHRDLPSGSYWAVADKAEAVKPFSAAAWWFGRHLREQFGPDLPIGLVNASWGGSRIEPWTPPQDRMSQGSSAGTRLVAQRPSFADWLKAFMASSPEVSRKAIRDWARPGIGLSEWRRASRQSMGGLSRPGIAWYRFEFEVPSARDGKELVFFADYVNDADETYVDGKLIGRTGPDNSNSWWSDPRRYPFVAKAGRHVLAIRAMDHLGTGEIGPKLGVKGPDGSLLADFSGGTWCERIEFRADIAKLGERPAVEASVPFTTPSALWNAMVAPVAEMNVRGAIWYQGCANGGEPLSYPARERQLIDGWRAAFRDAEMPFVVTQLSSLFEHRPDRPGAADAWKAVGPDARLGFAELREAQERMSGYPHTGLACTIDIGEMYDIHPKNKREVGRRLCHEAMRVAYGRPEFAPGPRVASVRRDGAAVLVRVGNAGTGLEVTGGRVNPHLFALADGKGEWHWADATLESADTLRVSAEGVALPTQVRWCWTGYPPDVNVRRASDGLPLFPFLRKLGGTTSLRP